MLLTFVAVQAAIAGIVKPRAGRTEAPDVDLVPRPTIEARLRAARGDNAGREAAIEQFFRQAGCPQVTEQPVSRQPLPNVVCTLPGSTGSVIIVGGHIDKVRKGQGVIDNWSGASLLPSLLESVRNKPRRHTFVFIGFTAEERGLVGSKYYAKHLTPAQVASVHAMINLDSLALGPTEVWLRHSDRRLAEVFYEVARSVQLPVQAFDPGDADDDSEPFIKLRVPTLMVHSVTNQTWHVLHSTDDNLHAVRLSDYYDTYRLLADYLGVIDTQLD
ncbi:MAG TPA: M28 family peptidase [Terriglobia bacterium]|nr:M28 family peptidase [Terriglobia bacterium]